MANSTEKKSTNKVAVGAAAAGLAVGAALGVFAKSDKAKKLKTEAGEKLNEAKTKTVAKEKELLGKLNDKKAELKKDFSTVKKNLKNTKRI